MKAIAVLLLLLANAALGTNPALIKDLPYDTLRDFAPISRRLRWSPIRRWCWSRIRRSMPAR